MSWVYLIIAGFFEAIWLVSLEKSESFSKLPFTLLAVLSMAISLFLFALSLAKIPLATAYLIWLSIGVSSVFLINFITEGSTISPMQLVFLSLIFIGILGLKTTQ
ncbi:DMT family transporter [Thalassotalea marina]|uniref:Guanidinium exporter n=1 Tax=Thalassotalea marina TaxID=1673741 RepID=A0A919BKZ1_9GAMM|nr:SMR family transporter [Thalassotalea marina]GHF96021.1 QacE family quaternary ammonium compound efflux SMR transporter [Thalassotalea marina]